MFDLKFSYNWNHKLDCNAFTTIRIYNPAKHRQGEKVNLFLKDRTIGSGTILSVHRFPLADLNEFIAYLDTGYSLKECQAIIHRMYPNVDFTVTKLALLLILKDKPVKSDQKELFKETETA